MSWGAAVAQPLPAEPPQNLLQLSATGSVDTQQDLLSINLSVTREAADPITVEQQLKAILEPAMADARRAALAGQMDLRSGRFTVTPRYGRDGRIAVWVGTAELILEGRDFTRISQTAGRLAGMSVAGLNFSLSREQHQKAESQAQQLAVERFRSRASELAKAFGFAGYSLREVSVASADRMPQPRLLAMAARDAGAQVPVEAGQSTVQVTVSGSVQMR